MSLRKVGKCANCCPDGGAIFRASWGDADERLWKCCNCGHTTKRYTIKSSGEMTESQTAVVKRLERAGWTITIEMIGRTVFVKGSKDRGSAGMNLIAGDSLYGTIGVRGAYKLTLQKFGGSIVITDEIGISVYL
jgi:hypothetical protein